MTDNYDVSIKVERNYFVEDKENREEAISEAVENFLDKIYTQKRDGLKIVCAKSTPSTKQEYLTEQQLHEISNASLQLSNAFNPQELKKLVEDLQFYIGSA